MKIGDLVLLKPEYCITDLDPGPGVITMISEYEDTGKWYRVDWSDGDFLWHRPGDLEILSET